MHRFSSESVNVSSTKCVDWLDEDEEEEKNTFWVEPLAVSH